MYFRLVSGAIEGLTLLERGQHVVGGLSEGWGQRVGNTVISKWVLVVLSVSVGLNAWLLNVVRCGRAQATSRTKSSVLESSAENTSKTYSDWHPSGSTGGDKNT